MLRRFKHMYYCHIWARPNYRYFREVFCYFVA